MGKHLVDLDEEALNVAQARLGTKTIKDTVNGALRRASEDRDAEVAAALDVLGRANLVDRAKAWR
jgi:Arc/MetJ family transcription regulator